MVSPVHSIWLVHRGGGADVASMPPAQGEAGPHIHVAQRRTNVSASSLSSIHRLLAGAAFRCVLAQPVRSPPVLRGPWFMSRGEPAEARDVQGACPLAHGEGAGSLVRTVMGWDPTCARCDGLGDRARGEAVGSLLRVGASMREGAVFHVKRRRGPGPLPDLSSGLGCPG